MPCRTPSRYFGLPVRSKAYPMTIMLLRIWLLDPQSHMLLGGAYGTPHGCAVRVARYLSAPATTDCRTRSRSGSRLGTMARSSRPGTAVLPQSNADAPKMSAVCNGEDMR